LTLEEDREKAFTRKLQLAFLAGKKAEARRYSQYTSKSILDDLLEQFDTSHWITSKGAGIGSQNMGKGAYGAGSVLQGYTAGEKGTMWPAVVDQTLKQRQCRHFLKGHCKRGRGCNFLHDPSIFCNDHQKVFLGGLPEHITQKALRKKMAKQGYKVLNAPKIYRGFTPQVCLGSVKQAQRLIEKGRISIDGLSVDVRPYKPNKALPIHIKKILDDDSRSVFLGGLPVGTTRQMIKYDLEQQGFRVVNQPIVKSGFTPQVMLKSAKIAQKLVYLKQIRVNNGLVDVRPFVRRSLTEN